MFVVPKDRGHRLPFSTYSRPRSTGLAAALFVRLQAFASALTVGPMLRAFARAAPNWRFNRTHCGRPANARHFILGICRPAATRRLT